MSGFAFVASRGVHPADAELLGPMAEAAPHRGEARFGRAAGGAVAAALGTGVGVASDAAGRLIVADTRLDEVDALARRLGRASEGIDEASLILEAFERWGVDCADELRGDFAFAIWDAPRGEVFAARDAFGMRPLFYALTPGHLLAASEIGQILAAPGFVRQLDERMLVGSLIGRAQSPRWTHFEGVRRLRPGHALRVDRTGARTRRYWQPARHADERPASITDYAAELSVLIDDSVRARLAVTDSPGLLLSGGIDSTSIAATAARLRAADTSVAALTTYSFAYDEIAECDERSLSDQVVAVTGQANHPVSVDRGFPLADDPEYPPDLDGPDILQSHVSMQLAASQARADGIELLMTGSAGDALFGERIFDYLGLLRQGGPRAVWRTSGPHAELVGRGRVELIRDHLVGRVPAAVWPAHRHPRTRGWLRRGRGDRRWRAPWMHPDAADRHGLTEAASDAVPRSELAGEARRRRHEALMLPGYAESAEYLERRFARAGIRFADPWADRRIADWVLSIPPARLSANGQDKWLLREAMRGSLPESARSGAFRASPAASYRYGLLHGAEHTVRRLLTRPLTAERGYVDAAALARTYEGYRQGRRPSLQESNAFWRWVALERWLRLVDP